MIKHSTISHTKLLMLSILFIGTHTTLFSSSPKNNNELEETIVIEKNAQRGILEKFTYYATKPNKKFQEAKTSFENNWIYETINFDRENNKILPDGNNKIAYTKMLQRNTASVLSTLIPLLMAGAFFYYNKGLIAGLGQVSGQSIHSALSTFYKMPLQDWYKNFCTVSLVNQNVAIAGLALFSQWCVTRPLAADSYVNPATWITDQTDHESVNNKTRTLLHVLSIAGIFYQACTIHPAIRLQNIAITTALQFAFSSALYLASLKNDKNAKKESISELANRMSDLVARTEALTENDVIVSLSESIPKMNQHIREIAIQAQQNIINQNTTKTITDTQDDIKAIYNTLNDLRRQDNLS